MDVKALAELSVEQAMIHKMVYEQKVQILAETKVTDQVHLFNFIAELVQPKTRALGDVDPTDLNKTGEQILVNYNIGPGANLKSAMGTWWGAFNAVTYFYDHQQGRIGPDQRLHDVWVGHGQAVTKRKAFELAVQYAQAA
jgi:hypothetical protein